MGDEHTVMPVFFAGIVFQALLISRSLAGAGRTGVIAVSSLAVVWFATRSVGGQVWTLPFFSILLFVILFALLHRDQLLPRITPALLLHYAFLGIYGTYISAGDAPVPLGFLAFMAIPALLALYLGLTTRPAGTVAKLMAYIWFLALLTAIIARQLLPDNFRALHEAEGYSFSFFVHVFVGGMVFLFFASNLVYMMMLVPSEKRDVFWDSILDNGRRQSRLHGDALIDKMGSERFSWMQWAMLMTHAGALVANYRLELVPPDVWMNVAVVGIAMLSTVLNATANVEAVASET